MIEFRRIGKGRDEHPKPISHANPTINQVSVITAGTRRFNSALRKFTTQ